MENVNDKPDRSISSHPKKKGGEQIVTNFPGVTLSMKDFSMESQMNPRLGVIIDWSKGTMVLQANK